MTTMQPAVGTARRQAGAARKQPMGSAANGARYRKAPSTSGRLATAPATTERRAVMVGHTVQILSAYDGLQGCYATVLWGDMGDGKVLVVVDGGWVARREICYLSRELRHVAMDDAIRHDADEECLLIRRHTELACFWDYLPPNQERTEELAARVDKRLERLRAQIRMIQRAESTRPGRRCCTALVLWEGGAR